MSEERVRSDLVRVHKDFIMFLRAYREELQTQFGRHVSLVEASKYLAILPKVRPHKEPSNPLDYFRF